MSAFLHTLTPITRFFDRAVQPNPRLTDEADQQRSRLLARILLLTVTIALILMPVAISLEETLEDDPEYLVLSVGVIFTIGLYVVNRRGAVETAAVGFISMTFIIFTFAPFAQGASDNLLGLAFVPVLLTAIFYSTRYVLIVGALVVACAGILNALDFSYAISVSLYTIILASVLLLTYIRHQQAMEAIRRAELQAANVNLRHSEERLQTLNAELEQRVDARTRDLALKNIELEQAWTAAKQADQVKSQFLASMSHELRTPLNAILNFTEFVQVGMLGPVNERQQDALGKSLDSGRHLLSLINDVLDITKIESDMMKLFVETDIDLDEIIETGVTTAQTLLKHKPVEFIAQIDTPLPRMTADKRRVRQILLNLLANACKFTEEGSVTLRVRDEGSTLLLSVIDTGPGIAKEDQSLIFEPFKQAKHGVQHANGTGLGLPISLRLVEAHYGQLWVESEAGRGAAFHVRLPVRAPELLGMINGVAV